MFPGLQDIGSAIELRLVSNIRHLGCLYLKAGVKLPRIPSTLKHSAVWRRKRFREANDDHRREKAQGWGLISTSSLSLVAPHQHAQHILSQNGLGAHQEPSKLRRGRWLGAGWAGNPNGSNRPGRRPCIGPAGPRALGALCRDLLQKGGLSKALPAPRPYFQSPNPASKGKEAADQHGLTQSHSCPRCHPTQGLSTPVCFSPFPSQAVAILIPPHVLGLSLEKP